MSVDKTISCSSIFLVYVRSYTYSSHKSKGKRLFDGWPHWVCKSNGSIFSVATKTVLYVLRRKECFRIQRMHIISKYYNKKNSAYMYIRMCICAGYRHKLRSSKRSSKVMRRQSMTWTGNCSKSCDLFIHAWLDSECMYIMVCWDWLGQKQIHYRYILQLPLYRVYNHLNAELVLNEIGTK